MDYIIIHKNGREALRTDFIIGTTLLRDSLYTFPNQNRGLARDYPLSGLPRIHLVIQPSLH